MVMRGLLFFFVFDSDFFACKDIQMGSRFCFVSFSARDSMQPDGVRGECCLLGFLFFRVVWMGDIFSTFF